jgi:hypothetical protein
MKKFLDYIIVALVSVILTLSLTTNVPKVIDGGSPWSNGFNNGYGCSTSEITKMYEGYVDEWKQDISKSFDEAEKIVFNDTPTPDIIGPHEDPDKCICKGSGVIVQGDGHKTVCPYHGSKFGKDVIIKPLQVLEE